MVWVAILVGCGGEPVPAHGGALDPIREGLLARDFAAMAAAAEPWMAPVDLAKSDAEAWSRVQGAAERLSTSTVPSTATENYGTLLAACAGCHHETSVVPAMPGHAEVFLALEFGVVRSDPDLRQAAAFEVAQRPELRASLGRLNQLAENMAESTSPAEQGRDYASALEECLRCHGLVPGL